MEKNQITISETGIVTVPIRVQMRDFEIARLFGIITSTIKANIRAILKSEVVTSDYTHGGTAIGSTIIPDYFGLDMVVALAFRVQSPQARLFRSWVINKMENESNTIRSQVFISIEAKSSSRCMN